MSSFTGPPTVKNDGITSEFTVRWQNNNYVRLTTLGMGLSKSGRVLTKQVLTIPKGGVETGHSDKEASGRGTCRDNGAARPNLGCGQI